MNIEGFKLMSEVPEKPVEWLWEGRIPLGEVTILEGDPGNNKSSLVYDLAARLTQGKEMPCVPPKRGRKRQGGALLLVGEDSPSKTVRRRLAAAGANLEKIGVFQHVAIPDDLLVIEKAIHQIDAKLIGVDALNDFLNCNVLGNQAVRKALEPLRELAERTNAAIVVIRHFVKSSSGNSLLRGGGSAGITAVARSQLKLYLHPSDPHMRVLLQDKSNLGPLSPSLAFIASTAAETQKALAAIKNLPPLPTDKILDATTAGRSARRHARKEEIAAKVIVPLPDDAIRLYHCRFQQLEQAAGIAPASVYLVCTDFPYGKEFLPEIADLGAMAQRILVEGGLLVTYSGHYYLDQVMRLLGDHLTYRWMAATTWSGDGTPVHPLDLISKHPKAVQWTSPDRFTTLWPPRFTASPWPISSPTRSIHERGKDQCESGRETRSEEGQARHEAKFRQSQPVLVQGISSREDVRLPKDVEESLRSSVTGGHAACISPLQV